MKTNDTSIDGKSYKIEVLARTNLTKTIFSTSFQVTFIEMVGDFETINTLNLVADFGYLKNSDKALKRVV